VTQALPGRGRSFSQLAEWAAILHLELDSPADIDWSKDHQQLVAVVPGLPLPAGARSLSAALKALQQKAARSDTRAAAACQRARARLFALLAGALVAMARNRYTDACMEPLVLGFDPDKPFNPGALYLPVTQAPCIDTAHHDHTGLVIWHEWAHHSETLPAISETFKVQVNADAALWFEAGAIHQRARRSLPKETAAASGWMTTGGQPAALAETDFPLGTPIEVPYDDREAAKQMGLKWAPSIRKWYAPHNMSPAQVEHIRKTFANRRRMQAPVGGPTLDITRQGRMFVDDFRRRVMQLWEEISAQATPGDPQLNIRMACALRGMQAGFEMLEHPGARDPQVLHEIHKILREALENCTP
jgi:hypothetical protein